MINMKEKNYKIYAEIENLDLLMDAMKEKEGKVINIFRNNQKGEVKGLFLDDYSRRRYFCECGFIGDTLNEIDRPVCKHCGNTLWLTTNSYLDYNVQTTEVKKTDKHWVLEIYKYKIEIINDDKTVKVVKDFVDRITLDKDYLNRFTDLENNLHVNYNKKDIDNLLKPLPVYDTWLKFKAKQRKDYYDIGYIDEDLAVGYLDEALAIVNNLMLGDIEEIEERFLRSQYGPEIIEMALKNVLNVRNANSAFDVYNVIFKDYDINDLVKKLGFENTQDSIFISLMNNNVYGYKDAIMLKNYRKHLSGKNKEFFNTLVLDGVFDKYYIQNRIDMFDENLEHITLFEEFYANYKHIFNNNSLSVFNDRVSYCKSNNLPLDIIPTKHFSSIQNLKSLEDQKIPKAKIEIFNHLIDEDPLKAYSFLANRRKLTKKETEEYKTIIEL